ncbi:MAG TPA: hypothetical protein ENI30_03745 [Gammaproteobacteria bacterium]|nr:hypothetical protein [Gammaproteobacteria bacterium]
MGAGLLAKVVNDDAGILDERGALRRCKSGTHISNNPNNGYTPKPKPKPTNHLTAAKPTQSAHAVLQPQAAR